jgi:hypothetical protein
MRMADPYSLTQVRRRCSTGFLLQPFQIRCKLDIVDPNFTGRREFDRARASVSSESGGAGGVEGGRCTIEAKLILGA